MFVCCWFFFFLLHTLKYRKINCCILTERYILSKECSTLSKRERFPITTCQNGHTRKRNGRQFLLINSRHCKGTTDTQEKYSESSKSFFFSFIRFLNKQLLFPYRNIKYDRFKIWKLLSTILNYICILVISD